MKSPPNTAELEKALRASKLVAAGFFGNDRRPLEEIVESDAATLLALNATVHELADRMRHITRLAERGLGTDVTVDNELEARAIEVRGRVPCPWPHPGTFRKTVVEMRRTSTGETIRWSALSLHMIEAHGFFQGRGSEFRLDPATLVRSIFFRDP